jgi:hypothetical protein
MLEIVPISFKDACDFVTKHHRHHRKPQGHKYSIACSDGQKIVGVVIVGRPVSRHMDNGRTLEVTRLATDGTRNVCSKLYNAAWKAARNMGYTKLITYILQSETGTSLRAAGWQEIGKCGGGSWDREKRTRDDKHPIESKVRFEIS